MAVSVLIIVVAVATYLHRLRVYVGNIPWSLKKVEATEELQQLCESQFGAVRDVDLAQDPQQERKDATDLF